MTGTLEPVAIGRDLRRHDGAAKAAGAAPYAHDHPTTDPAHLSMVRAAVARGRVVRIDDSAVRGTEGVLLVLTHENAPAVETDDAEMNILRSGEVHFRGQIIGAVAATTPEVAREAAALLRVEYETAEHDVAFAEDRADLYTPEKVNPAFPSDTEQGDVDGAMAAAAVTVEATYRTPWFVNNPMEPHTTVAHWTDDGLLLVDSTQSAHAVRETIAPMFGLDVERVRVTAPYVGGGFGSKGMPHAHVVLATMAAKLLPGRPVKLALTRPEMFALVGYRTPTVQRVRLAADADGVLSAIALDVVEQTSRIKEFAEQTAVPTRTMYAAPNRRTSHRLAALDVPVPSWMRAPGEAPGMFGPEVALDELAEACGVDPVELRVRNEPAVEPESGKPFSSRELVACLRQGAELFGWAGRDPRPRVRRENGWLVGTGVAASTYPAYRMPGSRARVEHLGGGRYRVEIGAADIGTGAWTVLAQIAADALGVPVADIELAIGDTDLPRASVAGGSSGTASWGTTIVAAAEAFRDKFGADPGDGDEIAADTPEYTVPRTHAAHAFGAQFAEVRVHEDTGEVRVPRLLGMFDVGRIINPRTARSQLVGGMVMGLSTTLHERAVMDTAHGHIANGDLAGYHIASHADVPDVQAHWLGKPDTRLNPMGSKGIGEIGIVGTAAAVANAAWHATGVRVRELPVTLDHFLG